MNDALRRAIRTIVQLIASGGLVWLTDALANDLDEDWIPYMLGIYTVVVVLAQNLLEDNTSFPALLKGRASSGVNPTSNAPSGVNPS